jgi:hypothetical protein
MDKHFNLSEKFYLIKGKHSSKILDIVVEDKMRKVKVTCVSFQAWMEVKKEVLDEILKIHSVDAPTDYPVHKLAKVVKELKFKYGTKGNVVIKQQGDPAAVKIIFPAKNKDLVKEVKKEARDLINKSL